jgi:inner membrane protein
MDVGTHGLASLVVARAFVPRAGWRAWAVIVAAGTVANVDWISSMFGPGAYLEWHRTYAHSILVSLVVSSILAAIYLMGGKGDPQVSSGAAMLRPHKAGSRSTFFAAVIVAGLLHLALDAGQSSGTMIFWPLSRQRTALDWLPRVDPWIIGILLVALLLSELTRLVSDEIGSKSRGPRGRVGAIVGLVVVAMYVGLRADLHSGAIATLRSLSYESGQPHRIAAHADAGSPFVWHGLVETERALHLPVVGTFTSAQFDPDTGETLFKPEASPILERAQNSDAAKRFLAVAQFPKADSEKTENGFQVELQDLRYAVTGETAREVRVRVELDPNGKVLSDELVWARDVSRR